MYNSCLSISAQGFKPDVRNTSKLKISPLTNFYKVFTRKCVESTRISHSANQYVNVQNVDRLTEATM